MGRLRLENKTKTIEVANNVRVARTFWQRAKGLLGEKSLPEGHALWIQGSDLVGCNSIHTFFMRFPIDVIFVDRNLKVTKVYRNLGPWRVTWPAPGAHSVFELPAGSLSLHTVEVGDQLYVGN